MSSNAPPRTHRFYLWIAGMLFALFLFIIFAGVLFQILLYLALRLFLGGILVLVVYFLYRAFAARMRKPPTS